MHRLLLRIITAIQLTRLTMAFGAVSDIWFVILLSRADPQYDVRHDSAFSPDRPIPAGRIRLGQAVVVAIGALIVAVLAANGLGGWPLRLTLLTAAGILFYNAAAKYIPSVGLVTIGLIHAVHMLIPNVQMSFMLPVWLVMTHAIVIAAAVHMLEDKRPRLGRRTMIVVALGWISWTIIVLGKGVMQTGGVWPDGVPLIGLIGPVLAVVAFLAVAWWKASGVTGAAAAEKLKRYGAMWQSLYGAAWLLALGLTVPAAWIAAFAIVGFASMTLIKEITGMTGRPVTYRG
ncbi:MAG: UbiA family prenyltransferase [Planctomycetota bacterium]